MKRISRKTCNRLVHEDLAKDRLHEGIKSIYVISISWEYALVPMYEVMKYYGTQTDHLWY